MTNPKPAFVANLKLTAAKTARTPVLTLAAAYIAAWILGVEGLPPIGDVVLALSITAVVVAWPLRYAYALLMAVLYLPVIPLIGDRK